MAQQKEVDYILDKLLPEFREQFQKWNAEYTQPRDLGARGEFAGLYRKARKLKSVLWDGVNADNWREGLRVIAMEIAAHAFLLVYDLDHEEKTSKSEVNGASAIVTHHARAVGRTCEVPNCWCRPVHIP